LPKAHGLQQHLYISSERMSTHLFIAHPRQFFVHALAQVGFLSVMKSKPSKWNVVTIQIQDSREPGSGKVVL